MGEDEIVRLFNAKIKLERKQYKKRVLQLAPERIYLQILLERYAYSEISGTSILI